MDAFYAAVEIRDRPELSDRPVVVGGNPERRGVVAAASYAARRYGIKSAMPTRRAARLCPHAVFLPPRMGHYAAVSRDLRALLDRYTPLVEPLALDEAFLDVTESQRLYGSAPHIGMRIRDELHTELGLTASVGVAPNKFLAKLASDIEKPNGFVVVDRDRIDEFLAPLPVSRLWGVGKSVEQRLASLGVFCIGDLQTRGSQWAAHHLGRLGGQISKLAHGIDDRPVVAGRPAKSISHETTFATDVTDAAQLATTLSRLTDRVARRLRAQGRHARTVAVKVRFRDFTTVTRSKHLPSPQRSTPPIWRTVQTLFTVARHARPQPIRLLGVAVSGLVEAHPQEELFHWATDQGDSTVDDLTDRIVERFGEGALYRGSSS